MGNDFAEQISRLINHAKELESENHKLRLALALCSHKRSRGRPKKLAKIKKTSQQRGRKPQDYSNALPFIESLKNKYDIKTDKAALQKWAEESAVNRGEGLYKANAPDVQAYLKVLRNHASKQRNPINSKK